MPEGDMLDFSQALSELQIGQADLENMIARGELRAFKSGGTMKFRRGDIDLLKKERATEPTIIIPAAGTAQFNVDVPQDLGVDESAATVVPETSPGGSAPTVNLGQHQSGTEEIVFEDSDLEILPVEHAGGDASAATSEVTVTAEEPVPAPAEERPARKSRREARAERDQTAPAAGPSRRVQAAYSNAPGNPVMTAIMVATSLLCVFIGSVLAVILWKDMYSEAKHATFVPAYLKSFQESAKTWFDPTR